MSELQSLLPSATIVHNNRNNRKTLSLTGGGPSITSSFVSDGFYREDHLIKQASTFASHHADIGPLNNLFSSKLMIKNKLNQIKFPQAYERDGNDLMRPNVKFNVQPLQLHQLTQAVMMNPDDYQSTIFNLKKHHQSRVMQQNSQRSALEFRDNIVSSASARGEAISQGTTGLLNIIDQNKEKEKSINKPPTAMGGTTTNAQTTGNRLQSRQFVFDGVRTDSPIRTSMYTANSPVTNQGELAQQFNQMQLMSTGATAQTSVYYKTGPTAFDRQPSGELPSRLSTIQPPNLTSLPSNINGNVVQIQRIKLVPVNQPVFQQSQESRLSSGGSPRGSTVIPGTRGQQTSYRGSAVHENRSAFMATNATLGGSRFHSTQRSTFIQGTINTQVDDELLDNDQMSKMMRTNVDKELPLKFKPFRKLNRIPKGAEGYSTIQALKSQKDELAKINAKKAKEEFLKNKFQRPSQLIAPIDSVDYFKTQSPQDIERKKAIAVERSKGVLLKNNETEQLKEPTNVRPHQYSKAVDFLSHTVTTKGKPINKSSTHTILG